MVLTLTGYFILFKEISSHDWWNKLASRVERRDHVNLKLFEVFKIYRLTDLQVVGNFIMLLPIGIYFPVLYRSLRRFIPVVFAAFAVSLTIELLQLATKYRSADVDDLLLNTAGAVVGFMIYKIVIGASRNPSQIKNLS
jgi:glycopeptide antibiotics resistance protein